MSPQPSIFYHKTSTSYQVAQEATRNSYLSCMKFRWLEVGINLLFWITTAWFIVSIFSIETQEVIIESDGFENIKTVRNQDLIYLLFYIVGVAATLFYCQIALVQRLKQGINISKLALLSAAFFFMAFLFCIGLPKLVIPWLKVLIPIPLTLGILLFYFAVASGYGIGKVWWTTEAQRQRLALEKKQAELNLLRAQLQPHFLFNVLNNLLAMVDQENNPKMARTIARLSGLLRYVVYETGDEKVLLEKDLQFIRDYADLQLMRYEQDEVDFQLAVKGPMHHQKVEPGIFISFVENAFKHGVQAEEQSFVHLNFDLTKPGSIIFTIKNSLHPNYPVSNQGGTGLMATQQRLNIIYPNQHQLKIERHPHFLVTLELTTT